MEAATLPEQQEDGAPVEEGAEATRSADHLFQYSQYVHVGPGAGDCAHATDGKCQDEDHFHAWMCLPNAIQQGDIQDKARAARSRRKLAMRDPETDSYVVLEAEVDDLMRGDREKVIVPVAEAELRKQMGELIDATRGEERFADYGQHREEWERLSAMPEDERPKEEFDQLEGLVKAYEDALEERITVTREREREVLRHMGDDDFREVLRTSRIEGEASEVDRQTYYIWMGFVCTRKPHKHQTRVFEALSDFRASAPEVLVALDKTLDRLESRVSRGDAAGN